MWELFSQIHQMQEKYRYAEQLNHSIIRLKVFLGKLLWILQVMS